MGDKNDIIPHTIPLAELNCMLEYTLIRKHLSIELVNKVITELKNKEIIQMREEIAELRQKLEDRKPSAVQEDYYEKTRPSRNQVSYETVPISPPSSPPPLIRHTINQSSQPVYNKPSLLQKPVYHMPHRPPSRQPSQPVCHMPQPVYPMQPVTLQVMPMPMPVPVHNRLSRRYNPYQRNENGKEKLCIYTEGHNPDCKYAHSINQLKICKYGKQCVCRDCNTVLHSETERKDMLERSNGLHQRLCFFFNKYGKCLKGANCDFIHWIPRIGVINN